jgi:Transposase DDE domain group 1
MVPNRKLSTMTHRTQKSSTLKRLRRHDVEAKFDGGTLTSDGGLLLLREADRKLKLIERINRAIPDPRDPRYCTHDQAEMLTSRIFGIAAGYEDGNDHHQLRHDPAFQVAAGRTPAEMNYEVNSPLASPSTLSRLENRVDAKACFKLHEELVEIFLDSFPEPPAEIVLDFDATDDPTHGNQEQRYFNGFYDGYCFLPLYVFCGDQLLVSYLRPSSVGAAHHARPIAKLLVQKIRQRWPDVRIILRGDSGFAIERLMRWCDKHDVFYVFGFAKNDVLIREIAEEMSHIRIRHAFLSTKQRCFKWFRYRAQKWDRYRWMVGKAEHGEKGANPRFVVTNLFSYEGLVDPVQGRPRINGKQVRMTIEPGTQCSVAVNPETFYEKMYCQRGDMENRIKEQQLYLFADRTSCTDFIANQFRLLLSSFAYVLVDGIRRIGLQGTKAATWQANTIRNRLIKIAARVVVTCRRVVFHLASSCPYAEIFNRACTQLSPSG